MSLKRSLLLTIFVMVDFVELWKHHFTFLLINYAMIKWNGQIYKSLQMVSNLISLFDRPTEEVHFQYKFKS